jgi:hypothetical protein
MSKAEMTVVHQCPPVGSGIMPCCGKTPFEVAGDGITLDPDEVTCIRNTKEIEG